MLPHRTTSHCLSCASPSTLSSGTYLTSQSMVSHICVLKVPFLSKVPISPDMHRSTTFCSLPASKNFIIQVLWPYIYPCQSSNVSRKQVHGAELAITGELELFWAFVLVDDRHRDADRLAIRI